MPWSSGLSADNARMCCVVPGAELNGGVMAGPGLDGYPKPPQARLAQPERRPGGKLPRWDSRRCPTDGRPLDEVADGGYPHHWVSAASKAAG